jgi:sugar lactone lactonase YvrE
LGVKPSLFVLSLLLPAFLVGAAPVQAADSTSPTWPSQDDPRLIPVYQADRVWNAVTTTTDGRVFVGFPPGNKPGPQLVEMDTPVHGHAYPTEEWNAWKPGEPAGNAFVHVNAIRIGPDGRLWVVDAGAQGFGKPAVPGAARAIGINLVTDQVEKIYPLGAAIKPKSYIDDIRFNGPRAYLTDAGSPGILVLDLASGAVRRVLDDDPTSIDARPMMADGRVVRDKKGKELRIHADQLEVSPDGRTLYYQPCSGPLARIDTRWLDDPELAPAEVARHARVWVDTPTSGGTAIGADGTIYYGDANRRALLTISPAGKVRTLIADPRLIWSDAMWIDSHDYLWIPATQQNLTPSFNDGRDAVRFPVWIYKMKIGTGPPARDHA